MEANLKQCPECGVLHDYMGSLPSLKNAVDAVNAIWTNDTPGSKIPAIKAWREKHRLPTPNEVEATRWDRLTSEHAEMKALLEHWIVDGHLQTAADRIRFRHAARALLAEINEGK